MAEVKQQPEEQQMPKRDLISFDDALKFVIEMHKGMNFRESFRKIKPRFFYATPSKTCPFYYHEKNEPKVPVAKRSRLDSEVPGTSATVAWTKPFYKWLLEFKVSTITASERFPDHKTVGQIRYKEATNEEMLLSPMYNQENPEDSPCLEDFYLSAVEILHKDIKSQFPTSKVYNLIKAIRRDSYSQESWKELYRKLAMEAYQYAAESGSEYALVWLFNCTCKMFFYIKDDVNFVLLILMNCGFTLYNLLLDMKSRYAYMHKTRLTFFDLLNEYRRQRHYFKQVYEIIEFSNQTRILMIIDYLLRSTLNSNIWNKSDAEFTVGGLRQEADYFPLNVPDFLKSLCYYQEGLIGSWESKWSDAKHCFSSSFKLLKTHFKEESIQAVYCYNALHELISVCTRRGEEETTRHSEMQALYEELKSDYLVTDSDKLPRKCIQQLALMRMALALGKIDDVKLYCNNLKFYSNVADMVRDQGISGEWAFTVLNYVLAVHCRLVRIDPNKSFVLRNLVFKNFAYKLRGPKRLAFMATLFVGLHYDFHWKEGEHWITGIGEYLMEKFLVPKYVDIPECRVYLAFSILCLANIYAVLGNKSKYLSILSVIMEFKKVSVHNLWSFIFMMHRSIRAGGYTRRTNAQERDLAEPFCQHRYEKAIVATRLREELQPETESAKLWFTYVYGKAKN